MLVQHQNLEHSPTLVWILQLDMLAYKESLGEAAPPPDPPLLSWVGLGVLLCSGSRCLDLQENKTGIVAIPA